MKVTVIGCGNAFSNINFNQSFILEEEFNGSTRRMLFDCGFKIPEAFYKANLSIKDINDIFISHNHADHCGGLEWVAFSRYDWMARPRKYEEGNYAPNLITNEQLIKDLWDKTLRGGLESMEGFVAGIDTFFKPIKIKPNRSFQWQGWNCELIQQIHIMSGNMISWTFGLFMTKEGHKSIYFTADSQHCSPRQIEIFYKKADIIIQDCECIGIDTKNKKFLFSSGVHANYAQLAGWPSANAIVLSEDIKKKMLLSHYQDFVTEGEDFLKNKCSWKALAKEDGFNGFISLGDVIVI